VLGRGLIPRGPQDDLKGKDPPVKGTKAPTRNILERKALRLALQGCAVVGKDRGGAPRLPACRSHADWCSRGASPRSHMTPRRPRSVFPAAIPSDTTGAARPGYTKPRRHAEFSASRPEQPRSALAPRVYPAPAGATRGDVAGVSFPGHRDAGAFRRAAGGWPTPGYRSPRRAARTLELRPRPRPTLRQRPACRLGNRHQMRGETGSKT
jgi:hypothetical protein